MFVCDADEKAIGWAKQLMSHGSVELWSGGRLVKLPCSDDKQAVSHEVHQGRLIPKGKK